MDRSKTEPHAASPLDALSRAAAHASGEGRAPVELWNPPDCGDIGLRIARDGTWLYQNDPIRRPALTRLFSTILRRDADRYVLVTPNEMTLIEVEDAPFLAVEMIRQESDGAPVLVFRTNVDDWVAADADHPLRFEKDAHDGVKPYLKVRGGLWALVARPLLHDLVAFGEMREIDGRRMFGVASARSFFEMAPAEDIEDHA